MLTYYLKCKKRYRKCIFIISGYFVLNAIPLNSCHQYKMNGIVNYISLAGDKFMSETDLKQPTFLDKSGSITVLVIRLLKTKKEVRNK